MKKLPCLLFALCLLFLLPAYSSAALGHYYEAWDFTTATSDADASTHILIDEISYNYTVWAFEWDNVNNETYDVTNDGYIEFTFDNYEINRTVPTLWMFTPDEWMYGISTNFWTTTITGTEVGWAGETLRFSAVKWMQYCLDHSMLDVSNDLEFRLEIYMNNKSISTIAYYLNFNVTVNFQSTFDVGTWYASLTPAEQTGFIIGVTVGGLVVIAGIVFTIMHFGVIAAPAFVVTKLGAIGTWAGAKTAGKVIGGTAVGASAKKGSLKPAGSVRRFFGKGFKGAGAGLISAGAFIAKDSVITLPNGQTVDCKLPVNASLPQCKPTKCYRA